MIIYLYSSDITGIGPIELMFPDKELKKVLLPQGTKVDEVGEILAGILTEDQRRAVIGPIEHLIMHTPCLPGSVIIGGREEGYAVDIHNVAAFAAPLSRFLKPRGHGGLGVAVIGPGLTQPLLDEMDGSEIDSKAGYQLLFRLAAELGHRVVLIPKFSALFSGAEDGELIVVAEPADDDDEWEDSVSVLSAQGDVRRVGSLDLFPLDGGAAMVSAD